MKKFVLLSLIIIVLFTLSCCNTTSEDDTETTNSKTQLTFSTEKTGEMKPICDNYYYAVIDSTSELQVYGLYYENSNSSEYYILIDKLGTGSLFFKENNGVLYYTCENKVKSVIMDGSTNVTLYAPEIYSSKHNYTIENIEMIQDGKIYCKASRWGITEETKNVIETVYLTIKTDNSGWEEISKNDLPADESQFDSILSNIKTTLNTDLHNILVKNFKINYKCSGNIDSAIFNVLVYNGSKDSEDYWTEGNIIVVFDNTVFFNVIDDEIVLSISDTKINDGMQTIDKIIEKAELSILQTKDFDSSKTSPEFYLLTYENEKYVEYIVENDSQVTYLLNSKDSFISSAKPDNMTSEDPNIKKQIYFIVVPCYDKNSIQTFVFEEDEDFVSGNYSVLLFDK